MNGSRNGTLSGLRRFSGICSSSAWAVAPFLISRVASCFVLRLKWSSATLENKEEQQASEYVDKETQQDSRVLDEKRICDKDQKLSAKNSFRLLLTVHRE